MLRSTRLPGLSILASGVLLLSGCSNAFGTECTTEFVYGVNVEVVDADTGEGIAEGATLTIRDGVYIEVVTQTFDGTTLSGAGERVGRYDLSLSRSGYEAWNRNGVSVFRGECHVTPVTVRAELQPL